ncbi:hypothetical protein EDB92DRAFT_2028806 [Lactarius akahatsu]|uniref:Uncharacterized protein n=1 Tax=Lactarius akahatsu TaxID=416441 RepID=A0AAD4LBS6_9AGAM|nr:hypothetical protein EDB92DRAFT_2028806 [Lactarius akahatsu]
MTYLDEVPPPNSIYVFTNSNSAIHAVKNPQSQTAQCHALMFYQALTILSLRHANFHLFLVWTPVDAELGGQWLAWDWVAQGCTRNPPDGVNRINSASFQKARVRTLAFNAWGHRWYANRLIPVFRSQVLGEPLSFHQTYTDIFPPDPKHPHPLWQQATAAEKLPSGRRQPRHTCHTTSTLMQVATDHAFTGTYVQRFHTNDPSENISCPCGKAVRDAEHIIRECPHFIRAQVDSGIYLARPGHPVSLPLLQSLLGTRKGIGMLLAFFDSRRALSALESSPPLPVPPEPN